MNCQKFSVGQKAEIYAPVAAPFFHRTIVTILTDEGHDTTHLVQLPSGRMIPVAAEFLHVFPPILENGREDIDDPVSWVQFELMTGIPADVVRGTDSEHG